MLSQNGDSAENLLKSVAIHECAKPSYNDIRHAVDDLKTHDQAQSHSITGPFVPTRFGPICFLPLFMCYHESRGEWSDWRADISQGVNVWHFFLWRWQP